MLRAGSRRTPLLVAAILSASWRALAGVSAAAVHGEAGIHIEDVARFYAVYDAARGHPNAHQLQQYLDTGSEGLHHWAETRKLTGEQIAQAIAAHPEMYSDARRCAGLLPRVRQRLRASLRKLVSLYPEARLQPITIAVGPGKTIGSGGARYGVQVGFEVLCTVAWQNPDLEERFVHTIAHEFGHVQQFDALNEDREPTVLERALVEGGAELTAELISGEPGEVNCSGLRAATLGRERDIEAAFAADEDNTDLSKWLDNSTLAKQGDLGYWVGYRIVKSYYRHAADKRRAFREILEMTDPKVILTKSGWYPGSLSAELQAPARKESRTFRGGRIYRSDRRRALGESLPHTCRALAEAGTSICLSRTTRSTSGRSLLA